MLGSLGLAAFPRVRNRSIVGVAQSPRVFANYRLMMPNGAQWERLGGIP